VDLRHHARTLQQAVHHAQQVGELRRDAQARHLWHRVYSRLSAGHPGMFGAMTARAEAQVMRLAVLYAVGDMSYVVTPAHLRAGLEVWRYCRDSARYLFGDRLGDATADEILRALRQAYPDSLTRSEITRDLFHRNKPASEISRALDLLDRHHLAESEQDRTGDGRPTERWCSVPQTYDINELDDISPKHWENRTDPATASDDISPTGEPSGSYVVPGHAAESRESLGKPTNVVHVVNVVAPSAAESLADLDEDDFREVV
jgi:hypothetical protein